MKSKRFTPYLFILPALVIFVLFVFVPVCETFRMSVYEWDLSGRAIKFIWFENFKRLISERLFWYALMYNGLLIVMSLLVQLPLAMMLAVMLS